MGKKDYTNFVDEIPDKNLKDFPPSQQTLYPKPIKDSNFRLDMQGKTSADEFNLQIQACSGAKKTSVRTTAPDTWGTVLVAKDSKATPADIRTAFKTSYNNKTNESV